MKFFDRIRGRTKKRELMFLSPDDFFTAIGKNGYVRLSEVPAVVAGCRRIAELIGSMTIHLMSNTDDGDIRIVNALSRKIDIDPCETMNRSQFMEYIVMCVLLYGKGNAIVRPQTKNGLLMNLQPIPPGRFTFLPDPTGYGYSILIDGTVYAPGDVLHFVYNPDEQFPWKGRGMTVALSNAAQILKQVQDTEMAFMQSKWKPSMIVRVDAVADQFSTKEGRKNLLSEYIETSEQGEPWVVPADQIDVKEIRPLSLADLAIKDTEAYNTKLIAALLGVPAFLLGEGTYNQKEWNNFVNARIRPMVVSIQQEMTRKLILSDKWYLRFNQRTLYDYDLGTLASVYYNGVDHGVVDRNEARDVLGLSPRDGLSELIQLENYIPNDMAALQEKAGSGGKEGEKMDQIRTIESKFQIREDGEEKRIEGYFSVFDTNYEIAPGLTESVDAHAFDRALSEDDVRALINHDTSLVLGRTTAGTLKLRTDDHGLWGSILINPNDQDAMNLYSRVKRGDVSQCSFGFEVRDENAEFSEDGSEHWTIKDVKLYEVSVCTFPAYQATHVSARSAEHDAAAEKDFESWRAKLEASHAWLRKEKD